jgi:hypothetical protein
MGSYYFVQKPSHPNPFTHTIQLFCRGGGTWSGQNKRSHRDGHRHIMWEELVGPTLLTCDNVEVSTTEALKDKKYVM